MTFNWINQLTEWNPQLFREIKGRLTARNLIITGGISLVGQLLFFLSWIGNAPKKYFSVQEPYCRLRETFAAAMRQSTQLQVQYDNLQSDLRNYTRSGNYDPQKVQELKAQIAVLQDKLNALKPLQMDHGCPADAIDFQLWWQDYYLQMFLWLSVGLMFVLLVVGAYMLISDLAQEERRGTLNFIRLSPPSTTNILTGKLLGVPILLYLSAVLAIPLHLWLGLSGHVPLNEIVCFWTILVASCAFFYSAALLFSLVSSGLGGFQAWFGSGAIFLLLVILNNQSIAGNPADWIKLFCPSAILPYLVNHIGQRYIDLPFARYSPQTWDWFYFPFAPVALRIVICSLVNYGLWTYWSWQAINRCFRNPNSTILSKRQSYGLVACWSVVALSFALQSPARGAHSYMPFEGCTYLLFLNLFLFVALIAALSPHRQTLQDWARYRQLGHGQENPKLKPLVRDLIWGEKSPAIVAIGINLLICAVPLVGWILLWSSENKQQMKALTIVGLMLTLILILAAFTQLMLLMKTPKRAMWATGTVAGVIFLPPLILNMLSIQPGRDLGGLWLFTSTPWLAVHVASATLVFQVFFIQYSILGVLTWQLTRQLKKAGESATKALLVGARG